MQTQRFEKTVRHDHRRNDVVAAVKKWNGRVKRHGAEVKIVEVENLQVRRDWFDGDLKMVHATRYVIEVPLVAGEAGKVLGVFELAEDNVSVYATPTPGHTAEDLDPFRGRWQECDHCKTNRRRAGSFVVERTDGERLVVGKSCAVAYMGLSFEAIVACMGAAIAVDDGEPEDCFFGGVRTFETRRLLDACWAVAKHHGGYNRDDADHLAQGVWLLLHEVSRPTDEDVKRRRALEETAAKVGALDLEGFAAYLDGARGDFADNLRIAVNCDRVEGKRLRLILAGVGLFVGKTLKREVDKVADAARAAPILVRGEVGARVDLGEVEVIRTFPFEGHYGTTLLVVLRAADGQNALWWSTAAKPPAAGERYLFKGTVKKHDKDRRTGEPQSTLTRCTFKPIPVKVQGELELA